MTVLGAFSAIISFGLIFIASSIFNGYALSVLWGWFVVPTFGVPALGIVPSIGIATVVGQLTTHQMNEHKKKDDDDRRLGKKIANFFLIALEKPAFALFFGYIVHLFM